MVVVLSLTSLCFNISLIVPLLTMTLRHANLVKHPLPEHIVPVRIRHSWN
ncbi:hypothetical protein GBAR_LOCUS30079 [Geodia barretti]|uniref:Uncharacterized protein n=1 Tax=Geodia barretti TaxID=519541 RepID=A0AA35TWS0_GEOBA|nr:hypothetical protein GBAR_LOCUS30079 [Geodia barretti]